MRIYSESELIEGLRKGEDSVISHMMKNYANSNFLLYLAEKIKLFLSMNILSF